MTADHIPLDKLFRSPTEYADGWYSFGWLAHVPSDLPVLTANKAWKGYDADWTQAWHGTSIETLY